MQENKRPIHPLRVVLYAFLVLFSLIYILPVLWLVITSFKDNTQIMASPLSLPSVWHTENYTEAFGNVITGFKNSLIVVSGTLIICVTLSTMAAYGLTRMKWKFSGAIRGFFMLGMMIPVNAIIIPLLLVYTNIGAVNSHSSLILTYSAFGFAQAIFIMSGFFASLPRELEEAAVIDGSSIWYAFWKIIFPISKSGIFVICLFIFNLCWNELLMGMVFISSTDKRTLPVALASFIGADSTDYAPMVASIVLSLIPSTVIYSCFSNQIVAGLTAGAVKG